METTMELDEFRSAWKSLDARLQREGELQFELLRDRRLERMRGRLRPLFIGQIVQILFALPFLALAGLFWSTQPAPWSAIVAGVVLHVWAVGTIIGAGVVLASLARIDYAAPVLAIQQQILHTRTCYIRSGMVAGLPWWFLWVVILMVLAGLGDVDLLAQAPLMVWGGLGVGVLGLMLTFQFHHWVRRPERAHFGRIMDDSLTGGSLRKAMAQLQEVQRFELD